MTIPLLSGWNATTVYPCAYESICNRIDYTTSHYLNIDLGELGQGYSADYTDAELDEILEEVAPFTRILTDKMQENNGEGR